MSDLFTASGSLRPHRYVWVDMTFCSDRKGFRRAVWFGLHAHPGRMWGCTVMFEDGAVYRNLPPHALAFGPKPDKDWEPGQAQLWDCYGYQFSLLVYDYLDALDAVALVKGQDVPCQYLFTAIPVGDGFTAVPEQEKEFMFLRTEGDRLTIQPTNRVRFIEKSFTDKDAAWPKHLRSNPTIWTCE